MSALNPIVNLSAYKFVELSNLETLSNQLLTRCLELQLKGTILIAPEGINCFMAGDRTTINAFIEFMHSYGEFADMQFKESLTDYQPFTRTLVKVKKEIITMGDLSVKPYQHTAQHLSATEFKKWLDEKRDIIVLDTRNDYEVRLGTFENALVFENLKTFRQFPDRVKELPDSIKHKPVVSFCTGGVRCEKASVVLERAGFKEVYQLDGGILKYFEEVGGQHFKGECFVFDHRVAVDANLAETNAVICYRCQNPVSAEEQRSEKYVLNQSCPYCYGLAELFHKEQIAEELKNRVS